MKRVVLGLGTNLGDRRENLRAGKTRKTPQTGRFSQISADF